MYKYHDKFMRLPVSSERAMTGIFNFPSFAVKLALEKIFTKKSFSDCGLKVHFFYGDNDWMEKNRAKELINKKRIKGTYNLIKNAGH